MPVPPLSTEKTEKVKECKSALSKYYAILKVPAGYCTVTVVTDMNYLTAIVVNSEQKIQDLILLYCLFYYM